MPAGVVFNGCSAGAQRVLSGVNPILAQGAARAGEALLARLEGDVTAWVPDGAWVTLDPQARTLRLD
jgi:hypothetical protein